MSHSSKLFRYLTLSVSISLLVSACAGAKQTNASAKTTPGSTNYIPVDKSLLWEISGNGLKKPSYLFGTIHLIGKEDFFFPTSLQDKIAAAEQATFEIDMDDMSSMESMMSIMSKAFMKDGKTLRDFITDKEYKLVNDHFAAKGLPLQMLERMKPMLLSTFASMDLGGGEDGSNTKSYEMEIFAKIKELHKPSLGLETVDDQLAIFDSIPYPAQAKMLMESIKSADKENAEYKKMAEMYKKQDIEQMAKLSVEGDEGLGGYENLFLYDRNKKWIPLMSAMMNDKSTFFAVGAGHLGGPKGVINLLKLAGYKITAVKMGLGA
ncbi:MAG: TraB/GumN family protein [Saprospiraceae bacterium]